jgi:hypothetical protein
MAYCPVGPYVFQSGKKEGKAAEQLMFEDYSFLRFLLRKAEEGSGGSGKKNKMHQHLEWLLARGEDRKVEKLCPHCRQSPIRYISVMGGDTYGYSMGAGFTCCENQQCKERLITDRMPIFLPVKFSASLQFRNKSDQKQFLRLLKNIFGIGKLTKEKAFDFFKG